MQLNQDFGSEFAIAKSQYFPYSHPMFDVNCKLKWKKQMKMCRLNKKQCEMERKLIRC